MMGLRRMGMIGRLKTALGAVAMFALGGFPALAATINVGQPTDGEMGLQPSVTALGQKVGNFYDHLLLPIIVAICLFVLALLIWIMVRYNRKANPVPARFSHNTLIEIIWTVVPVGILVVIAVFSLGLLKEYNDTPKVDVVVKATGSQWFWTYDYPGLGIEGIESRLLPDAADVNKAKEKGVPYLLATDNKIVVPVNKVIQVQVTASDVIHSWTVPAFRVKVDAIPGRLNTLWFKAEKTGVYYGQCSELCGKDHAYMPIEVHVVTDAEFDAWVIEHGGKTSAMIAAEEKAAAEAAKAAAASASESAAPASEAAPAPPAAAPATPTQSPAPAEPAAATPTAH